MNEQKLLDALSLDEGRRARIYTDTVGKVSGGVGRNLTDKGFRQDEIDLMLRNDIAESVAELDRVAPWWRGLNDARQNALVNMMFNLGATRLMGFKKFLAALQVGDWAKAESEMLDSKWARQVGSRSTRLALLIRTGEF